MQLGVELDRYIAGKKINWRAPVREATSKGKSAAVVCGRKGWRELSQAATGLGEGGGGGGASVSQWDD